MLVIKLEFHPLGNSKKARKIGEIHIGNRGMDWNDPETGREYIYEANLDAFDGAGDPKHASPGISSRGMVKHRREEGAFKLLQKILNQIFSEKTPPRN